MLSPIRKFYKIKSSSLYAICIRLTLGGGISVHSISFSNHHWHSLKVLPKCAPLGAVYPCSAKKKITTTITTTIFFPKKKTILLVLDFKIKISKFWSHLKKLCAPKNRLDHPELGVRISERFRKLSKSQSCL